MVKIYSSLLPQVYVYNIYSFFEVDLDLPMYSVYLFWLREAVSPKQSSTCAFYLPRRGNFSAAMTFFPEQTQQVTVLSPGICAGLDLLPWLLCPPAWQPGSTIRRVTLCW